MSRISIRTALVAALAFAAIPAAVAQSSAAPPGSLTAKLHAQRSSPLDLELGGKIKGVPPGETRFLRREDLVAASQPMTISPDDGNFKSPSKVRAVPLDALARALGVPASDMVIAICKDKYRGHYPRAYLAAHHPVLVTELNGKPLPGSPSEEGADAPGPYLIAHASFPRMSKDPVDSDEPQIPWGVVRLDFRDEETVLLPIMPPFGGLSTAEAYGIAQENCLRCHNVGDLGGLKSGVNWTVLGALAANSPDFFTQYVRDPKSKNPKTQMPASPEYNDATMQALVAYFKRLAPAGKH